MTRRVPAVPPSRPAADQQPEKRERRPDPLLAAAEEVGKVVAARVDRPWKVGSLCLLAAISFTFLRVAVAAKGKVGGFVVLGSEYKQQSAHLPAGIPVMRGSGYDGQFYLRLALDPLDFARTAFGITFDTMGRLDRITYSTLAWLLAAGHSSLVPWSMITVNILAFSAMGIVGAAFAVGNDRHPLWGLMFVGYFGFLWSMGRDLTELVAATCLLAGLLALRHDRPVLAGVALAASVLARETGLVVVGCLALADVWRWAMPANRVSGRPAGERVRAMLTEALGWVVPLLAFLSWQGFVWAKSGTLPIRATGQSNLAQPFEGMWRAMVHYIPRLPDTRSLLWCGELILLCLAVGSAIAVWRHSKARLHERLAFITLIIVTVSIAPDVWLGDVGFRSLYDIYILSVILLISSPRRMRVLPLLMGAAWIVVAGELILFI